MTNFIEVCDMKKLLLCPLCLVVLLAGCSSRDFVKAPLENQTKTFKVVDADATYSKAVTCITHQVRPAKSGQFFTYESEKFKKFVVTFTLHSLEDNFGTTSTDAVMYYTTNGDEVTVEVGDLRQCSVTFGCQSQDEFYGNQYDFFKPRVQATLDNFVNCVQK